MPAFLVPAVLSAIQTGMGIIQRAKSRKEQQSLLNQLKPIQTPVEIDKMLQATEQRASIGLPSSTITMANNEADMALGSSLDVARRLGGDANILSTLSNQRMGQLGNLIALDDQAQMRNFSTFLSGLNIKAANTAAEEKSKQDIIKNRLAAAGVNLSTANQNISGGLSNLINVEATKAAGDLFGNSNDSSGVLDSIKSLFQSKNRTDLAGAIPTDPLTPNMVPSNTVSPLTPPLEVSLDNVINLIAKNLNVQ